jgi:Na+-transporting methylmalonyl-CoA/oxaloacetate decarboxylase gamma subunit
VEGDEVDFLKLGAGITMAGCSLVALFFLILILAAIWSIGC